jgi:exopolyphosphatase/guanosine-5'-triphosphate,3'-diphosphate pyrophosphatase
VVSGHREAELTAKGVLSSTEMPSSLIIDMGGGSTEWILCRGRDVLRFGSIDAGAIRLLERHIKTDPPSKREIDALREETGRVSGLIEDGLSGLIEADAELVASAGTAATLASIDMGLESFDPARVHMHPISLDRLIKLSEVLSSLTLRERAAIRGLEASRADLIIPGIVFTIKLMETLGFSRLVVSAYGLLEGALLDLSAEVST